MLVSRRWSSVIGARAVETNLIKSVQNKRQDESLLE